MSLICPECKSADGLWANATFEGWHSIDVVIEDGRRLVRKAKKGHPHYEVSSWEPEVDPRELEIGCSCGWEGDPSQLIQLGTDGRPLPEIPEGQESLL